MENLKDSSIEACEKAWLDANRLAIDAYNKRIEEQGTLLCSHWE